MTKKQLYPVWRLQIVIALMLLTMVSHAQQLLEAEKKQWVNGWTMGGSFHTGTLLNHHNYMGILNEENTWLVELYMAKQAVGSQPWHSFFGYPDYGVKLSIIDLGSPTFIGKAYTRHPFMKFYLLKNNRKFTPTITAGAGPAYVEKIFNRHSNYKNAAIGSHINAFLQLQFDLNIRVTDNIYVFTGLALSHLSNGSFKKPNAGANILSTKIGAGYSFYEPKKQPLVDGFATYAAQKNWSYRAIVSGGLKRIDIGGDQFGVLSMSFEASRKHLAFTRFSGSFDIFYDASDYHAIHHQLYYNGSINRLQTIKAGAAVGYELLFGEKIATNIQLGAYLHTEHKAVGSVYQRFTLRYMPIERIGVQFGLKSHMAAADYIELGCIYKIR